MSDNLISIQFNWIREMESEKVIDLRNFVNLYKSLGFKTDGGHVDIHFTNKKLKKMGNNTLNNKKLHIAKQVILKYAAFSEYTNIYTFFDSEKFIRNISDFTENEMNGQDRVETQEIKDKNVFANNFEGIITAPKIFKVIRKNPLVVFYNELYKSVANRSFALDQQITLEITLEDKHEWDADTDCLNLSIQLEPPRSA